MFVNNVTCLQQQQQQPLAIHYDKDRHSIVNDISGNGGGATRNNNYRFVLDMTQ